mgnify:CR=1 FL=1
MGCLNHVCREVQVFLVILRPVSRFILWRILLVLVRRLPFSVIRRHLLPVMRLLSALSVLGIGSLLRIRVRLLRRHLRLCRPVIRRLLSLHRLRCRLLWRLLYILSGLLWRHLSDRLLGHRFLFRYILDFLLRRLLLGLLHEVEQAALIHRPFLLLDFLVHRLPVLLGGV